MHANTLHDIAKQARSQNLNECIAHCEAVILERAKNGHFGSTFDIPRDNVNIAHVAKYFRDLGYFANCSPSGELLIRW